MYTTVKCSTEYMNSVRQHEIINSSLFRFSWSEEKERISCPPRNNDEGEEVKYLIFIINKYTACMGERRGIYRVLVGKPEGKRPLGQPRLTWEDNIKTDLQEVGYGVWTGSSGLRIGTGSRHL
jgi:hypothetical protein